MLSCSIPSAAQKYISKVKELDNVVWWFYVNIHALCVPNSAVSNMLCSMANSLL
jgi:hypothetical protein